MLNVPNSDCVDYNSIFVKTLLHMTDRLEFDCFSVFPYMQFLAHLLSAFLNCRNKLWPTSTSVVTLSHRAIICVLWDLRDKIEIQFGSVPGFSRGAEPRT